MLLVVFLNTIFLVKTHINVNCSYYLTTPTCEDNSIEETLFVNYILNYFIGLYSLLFRIITQIRLIVFKMLMSFSLQLRKIEADSSYSINKRQCYSSRYGEETAPDKLNWKRKLCIRVTNSVP